MDKEQCRLCGKSVNFDDILEITLELKKLIEYHCRIELCVLESYPKSVCYDCCTTVESFARFSDDVKIQQLKFSALLQEIKVEIEELPTLFTSEATAEYFEETKEEKEDIADICQLTEEDHSKPIEESEFENSSESSESDSDYEEVKNNKRKRPVKHRRVRLKRRKSVKPDDNNEENEILDEVPESERYKNGSIKKKSLSLYEGKTWNDLDVQCVECNQVTKGPFELRNHHVKFHSLDSQFKCTECVTQNDVNFSYFYQFLNHYSDHHQKHLKFCCVICSEMFWNTRSLNQHMSMCHNKTDRSAVFHCKRCGQYFRKAFDLVKHEARVHNIESSPTEVDSTKVSSLTMEDIFDEEFSSELFIQKSPFQLQDDQQNQDGSVTEECKEMYSEIMWNNIATHQCCHCGIQSYTAYELYEHYNSDHRDSKNNFTCKNCPDHKIFLNLESYVNHIFTMHHEHLRYFCFICYDGYWNYKTLYHHYKTEHEDYKALICLYCGKYHKSVYDIRNHKEIHSPKHKVEKKSKNFTCSICSKSFARENLLQRHMDIHVNTENKLWICETCGKSFNAKSTLINHAIVHQTEKPFVCTVCGEGFKNKYKLKHHKGIHTGERNFGCEICGRRFRAKGTLKGHILTHTGERPFGCEFCDKKFAAKYDLMVHTRLHTGEFTHECQICHERYPSWSNYSKHMRGRHQIDPRSEKKKKYDAIAKSYQDKRNDAQPEIDQSTQYFSI